jgi:hypothetical protein
MSAFVGQNYGYHEGDMVILTDDQRSPRRQPTKHNILCAMHWLVKMLNQTTLFFSTTLVIHFVLNISFADISRATAVSWRTLMATKKITAMR